MVVILGAGLAGLSAAFHLDGRDRLVLEREPEIGGLCRSIREHGFTFDYTGHLLHLRDPSIRGWVLDLLPAGWTHLHRSAWIHSHDVLTPYPFQANTAGLPLDVRLECLLGFVDTLRRPHAEVPVPAAEPLDPALPFLRVAPPPADDEPTFLDWIHAQFGAGFAKHFFEPYNGKMWRRPLDHVTGDWVSWSIPRPELRDVLRGAITANDKAFGYNPDFLYPKHGGIDHLPRSIAAALPDDVVRTRCAAVSLVAGNRRVTLSDGSVETGEVVLSSLPLDVLCDLTVDLPDDLRRDARRLSCVGIRAVNLGVRGEAVHPGAQWVYVPDEAVPFHRIGLPAALTPAMAPAGHHTLVTEISYVPEADPGRDAHLHGTLDALLRMGFLRSLDDVVHTRVVDIPHAYVVFDRARREVLPKLLRWFLDRGVAPMGRYGSWDYLAMEDSLVHGRQVAAWIAARS
ncbi:MAG: FAD-dependent oxidoreductase [Planctomycetes bacterium]|nr:FAD-dependent oxidoreductase [Planctomycetota bacterium]